MISRRSLLLAFSSVIAMQRVFLPLAAADDAYPSRPIHVIVPNPPGGPGDLITRVVTDKAASALGQPLIVEYKAGASTAIDVSLVIPLVESESQSRRKRKG